MFLLPVVCPPFSQSGNTALSRASAYGHADVARILLLAGARLESTNAEGLTPLHRACRWGHVDVVEVLVSSGALVNPLDIVSDPPVYSAFTCWFSFRSVLCCVRLGRLPVAHSLVCQKSCCQDVRLWLLFSL